MVIEEVVVGAEGAVGSAQHGGAIGEGSGCVDGAHALRCGWRQRLRGGRSDGLRGRRVLTLGVEGREQGREEGHQKGEGQGLFQGAHAGVDADHAGHPNRVGRSGAVNGRVPLHFPRTAKPLFI